MTAFNGAKHISEQLTSFASQTRIPDEVVVCDDMSSDDTLKILHMFSRDAPFKLIIHSNDINLGYTRNFEKALSLCSGDLVFLSDQDDFWYSNKISRIIEIKNRNPSVDVIICDAMYTDGTLKPSGITVLEKVLRFSGRKHDHIAGACTAITKEFRDFILPFPESNCPAHDVYIHRWAKLLNIKMVVNDVLQVWRIHENNNSRSEMNNARAIINLELYRKYKDIDSSIGYLIKAREFKEMQSLAIERKTSLCLISPSINVCQVNNEISNIIKANVDRSRLSKENRFNRIKLIFIMMICGQYKYFQGIRSVVKDILR
jgi:glycosyltransferase involved in cell wall biosynthesis